MVDDWSGMMPDSKTWVWLSMAVLLAACGHPGGPAYPPGPDVQFHLGTFEARSGYRLAELPSGVHAIHLDPNIVVGTRDIAYVRDGGCLDGACSVDFRFSPEGGKRMLRVSEAAIGRQMAIVVDGKVVSVADISGPIRDGLRLSTTSEEESQALIRQIAVVPQHVD